MEEELQEERKKNYAYIIVCAIVLLAGGVGFHQVTKNAGEFKVRPSKEEVYPDMPVALIADAAIIYDIGRDRVLAGKNPKEPKSIASITKLTSAIIAFSRLSEEDKTTITQDDFSVLLSSTTPLILNDTWRTIDLLEYSLITSSNRGIHAVSRTIEEKTGTSLVELMNNFAQRNSLVQTHFVNSTGLDAHRTLAGSESSALDLAKMAAIIIRNESELAKAATQKEKTFYSLDGVRYQTTNTNTLLGAIQDPVLLSKTGYTGIAGGALIMVIKKEERDIALVVLDSTKEGRFEDMRRLLYVTNNLTR